MIKSLKSTNNKFKQIDFDPGFNVIIAERTAESSDRDSRNGLGKSLVIEIIHFCLGSGMGEALKSSELADWTFILDLEIKQKSLSVYRNTKDFHYVRLMGDFSDWPIKPEEDPESGEMRMSVKNWCYVAGYLLYGLSVEAQEQKYSPTFRSLLSYTIRRGLPAFQNPFKHFPQQKEWDIQVNNAFLLSLNYEYASEFQLLKDELKVLQDIKKAVGLGMLKDLMGSLGDLEAQRVRLSAEIESHDEELKSFQVHPQYFDIQEEADRLTKSIHEINNGYTINRNIFDRYHESFLEEKDVSTDDMKRLYEEAGLIFPELIVKRIDDVLDFHTKVIRNRKSYLESEIQRITNEMRSQEANIKKLSDKRGKLLSVLQTHGALEEHSKMQNYLTSLQQEQERTISKIADIKRIEQGQSEIKMRKATLVKTARADREERSHRVDEIIKVFNQNSEYLYSQPGNFSIMVTDTGYKFNVSIQRSGSQGISYMKVFTYDITLMEFRKNLDNPEFLIHDSTIFDGVDERQVAKALELAYSKSHDTKTQYICTMNSDDIPEREFSDGFLEKFQDSVRVVFTDSSEEGGLLGFRF